MSPLFVAVRRAALLCLPFAAVFAAGVTLSTRVCAQASGPLGWVPLPRPGVTNPQTNPPTGGDYDWTGLSTRLTLTPYSGPPFIYPGDPNTRFYGGAEAGASNRPMETTSNFMGTGGPSGNVDAQADFVLPIPNLDGGDTSTYYWQWDPPNDAAGQPDLTNFPVPPLFVLGKGYSVMRSDLPSSPNVAGLSVTASVSSGIGSGPPLTVNTPPDTFPISKSQTDYAILTPVVDSPLIKKQELKPTVSYTAKGVFGQYEEWAGGESQNWVGVSDNLYPITLSAPDPFQRPDKGQGAINQFYYDKHSLTAPFPGGFLYIPGTVSLTGATQPDIQWLVDNNKVDLRVENSVIPNTLQHSWTVGSGTISVHVPNRLSQDGSSGSNFPDGNWIFQGLPSNNNQFGNHDVNMYVQGTLSQTAKIQTFYPNDGNNFPGADPQQGVQNWYHYYNQVYRSPDDPGDGSDDAYNDGLTAEYGVCFFYPPIPYHPEWLYPYSAWRSEINIGPRAGGATTVKVFDIGNDGFVRRIGSLLLRGVHTYVITCAHEKAHRTLFSMGIYYPYKAGSVPPPIGFVDGDKDGIDDVWEEKHHLDNTRGDTTSSFPLYTSSTGDISTGDCECLCEILGFKELLAQKDLWHQDWSTNGIQHGAPEFVPPDFFWHFHADQNGKTFKAGTDYNIRSLGDLKNEYPSVLSDLP